MSVHNSKAAGTHVHVSTITMGIMGRGFKIAHAYSDHVHLERENNFARNIDSVATLC